MHCEHGLFFGERRLEKDNLFLRDYNHKRGAAIERNGDTHRTNSVETGSDRVSFHPTGQNKHIIFISANGSIAILHA